MQSAQVRDALEQCADLVLRCSDGTRIPCCRFQCVLTCDVIRHVAEDVELERDERGRAVVPFPGVCALDLGAAVDVIHGVRALADLDRDSVPRALRGMRALGHVALVPGLMERLWADLEPEGCTAATLTHLDDLLHTPSVRLAVLRAVVRHFPTWAAFSGLLALVRMDADLATWLLRTLSAFFPAGPLFERVLRLLPAGALDAAAVLRLFVDPGTTLSYHPAEAQDVLAAVRDKLAEGGWQPEVTEFLREVLLAMRAEHDVAPLSAETLHGTYFDTEAQVSSALLCVGTRRGPCRRIAPWLTLAVDWDTGAVHARVLTDKLGQGRRVRALQVRVTAYSSRDSEEVWYAVDSLPLGAVMDLRAQQHRAGDRVAFEAAVRSPDVQRLRVDVFFGARSVLDRPV